MHHAWFTAAVPDAPTVVLTLRLRPYSLGHEILLQRLRSPLVAVEVRGSESPDVCTALILATLICSQTFEAASRSLHSPFLGLFLKLWAFRLNPFTICDLRLTRRGPGNPRKSSIVNRKSRGPDWQKELLAFAAYRAAGQWMPEINPPKAGRSLKSPWQFRLLATLMSELHMSASDALNFPLAFAHGLYAAKGDLEGTLDLFGPADQALLDAVTKMDQSDPPDPSPK